jgi:hypothetical protein
MSQTTDERRYERRPLQQRVRVISMGKVVATAVAINVGVGGVFLKASTRLPVGSHLRVALPTGGPSGLEAEGTVVRSDPGGMAVSFSQTLEASSMDAILKAPVAAPFGGFLSAYRAYFQVSRNQDLADCEKLLGVSKKTFRTSFYISFFSCIALAILPVWLYRASIPAAPNWLKIVLSFLYGAFWLAVIQPSVDLAVFRIVRARH